MWSKKPFTGESRSMRGLDRAKTVFGMALKDYNAIIEMQNNQKIADEIFGFHAQQAVEKSLKAWIAALGLEYPQTHNLISLLAVLEEQHHDVAAFWEFSSLGAFAVQFRYEAYSDLGSALDRIEVVRMVGELVSRVETVLQNAGHGK